MVLIKKREKNLSSVCSTKLSRLMILFKDRQSAGKLLAGRLKKYKSLRDTYVLAIPRGGGVVAKEIAKSLNLPLDIIVTRKIGDPHQKELSLGAIDPDGEIIWDEKIVEDLRIKIDSLRADIDREKEEIKRRETLYRQGKPLQVRGQTVILVDDGIATGYTVLAAIKYLKRHGANQITVAVPVASKEALSLIESLVERVVVLTVPEPFQAVSKFYHNFQAVADEEVVNILDNM